jgi:large subunit ribosomal protein L15
MQKHTLKRQHKNKKRRMVGRGGKHAKTSGRGTKGQNARAGHKKRPEIRDFIKRIPKLRGRGVNINTSIQIKPSVVNLGDINMAYKAGETVNPETLIQKGLLKRKGTTVKILGAGAFDKKLSFVGVSISGSAKEAIEKASGTITA